MRFRYLIIILVASVFALARAEEAKHESSAPAAGYEAQPATASSSEKKSDGVVHINADSKKEKKERTYTQKEHDDIMKKEIDRVLVKIGKEGVVEFTNELLKKEKELRDREIELKTKEEQVEINKVDFQKRVKEFQEKQKKLLACIDDVEEQQSKRIQHMVDTVSGMRPQAAAQVLSVQDAEIAVKILGMLDSEKVSKIFNLMDKEISARLQKQYMTMKK